MWRNLWLTIATGATIALTVFSLSSLLAIHVGIAQVVRSVESQLDLTLTLYPTVTESQANTLVVAINGLPNVKKVTYVSKEQVLEEQKQSGDAEVLRSLEAIGENPFGASLIVEATDSKAYLAIIDELKKEQYSALIEGQEKHFEENKNFLQNFSNFADKVRYAALAVTAVFALISALMVFNAVRVAIYTQREEITVMRLVGATSSFIRGPYLAELFIYSVTSVIIGGALFMGLLYAGQPYLSTYFGQENVNLLGYFQDNALLIFGAQFVGLMLLSMVSASLAVQRYLSV
jgi:cell division transport system permease protein